MHCSDSVIRSTWLSDFAQCLQCVSGTCRRVFDDLNDLLEPNVCQLKERTVRICSGPHTLAFLRLQQPHI